MHWSIIAHYQHSDHKYVMWLSPLKKTQFCVPRISVLLWQAFAVITTSAEARYANKLICQYARLQGRPIYYLTHIAFCWEFNGASTHPSWRTRSWSSVNHWVLGGTLARVTLYQCMLHATDCRHGFTWHFLTVPCLVSLRKKGTGCTCDSDFQASPKVLVGRWSSVTARRERKTRVWMIACPVNRGRNLCCAPRPLLAESTNRNAERTCYLKSLTSLSLV